MNEYVINYINGLLMKTNDEDFDNEVFEEWLITKDIESKNNPNAYIKSCFKKELDNGTFKPKAVVDYLPNTQELVNALRDNGVIVLVEDTDWLNVAWWHILNKEKLPIEECKKLNRNILGYMKTKEFDEYKNLLMNSNTLKPLKLDWELIENEARVAHKHWLELMDELESEE